MKKVILWVQKHSKILKGIFLLSVCTIVVNEVVSIGKTVSLVQLSAVFSKLSLIAIIGLTLVGIISILPMLLYDFVLVGLLERKFSKKYIIETSWVTNTINNLCGFGGLVSSGLRTEFYGKDSSGKKVAKGLSKILLFLLSGLSIYCFISLLFILVVQEKQLLNQYGLWLLGGGLYFPLVLAITHRKNNAIFSDLALKQEGTLIAASFFEWTGVVATFLFAGKALGLSFRLTEIIPLLIACSVMGIVSMLPGGLGSFDVLMVLGLSFFGIPHEIAIAWLLLYRLFYYIIPFIIGVVLLIRNVGTTINQHFHDIPRTAAAKFSHNLLVASLYFSGIMMILTATIPEAFKDYPLLAQLNPLSFHLLTQTPTLVLGFLLLAMGRGASAKVKKAYFPTIILLSGTIIYTFWKDFSWGVILFLMAVLLFVAVSKIEFYRERLVYSWEMLSKDVFLYAGLYILYAAIGVYNLPDRHHRHRPIPNFFLFPSERIWFTGFVTIIVTLIFLFIFLRYLMGKKKVFGENFEKKRVSNILTKFGGNETSQLAFVGDKQFYYFRNDQGTDEVFFQFKQIADKWIVMGEPSGKKDSFAKAAEGIIDEADRQGYKLVFYEVKESFLLMLHEQGFDFLKMGEEAYVDLKDFSTVGKKFKGERALMNKFARENFSFEIIDPPFSQDTLKELRAVSDEWLAGRVEKGFSVGYFDPAYLNSASMALVKDETGKIIAFANIMPTYTEASISIDLMRHRSDSPSGIMDFLFISLFVYYQQEKYHTEIPYSFPYSSFRRSSTFFNPIPEN